MAYVQQPIYAQQPQICYQSAPPPVVVQQQPQVVVQPAMQQVAAPSHTVVVTGGGGGGGNICPMCRNSMTPMVKDEMGSYGWIWVGVLFFLMVWPCCLFPFCMSSCQDKVLRFLLLFSLIVLHFQI